MKPLVLGLVGPTASGKSALAQTLALDLGGEIVCMDSMQVYRDMDIGTAKPGPEEMAQVPHHVFSVVDPAQPFSVAEYRPLADRAIRDIVARGRLPILCGGTGLYLKALSGGMAFGGAPAHPGIRARWQEVAEKQGNQAVHKALMEQDPLSAKALHPNNLRRVIRALEVLELTGRPFSQQGGETVEAPYDLRLFALEWPRETLYRRIDERVGEMLEMGLFQEVSSLLNRGLSPDCQSMQGLGYKELAGVVKGSQGLQEAVDILARRTRNYAKRQLTWFKADRRIHWLPGDRPMQTQCDQIKQEMDRV